jgi:mRNA-degrading endonuclease toxin of MazEF toxin-antitoxin module
VISADVFNRHSPTVTVVPLTSNLKDPFPSEFLIESSEKNGLTTMSRYLGSQIITIDKTFLHVQIGVLEEKYQEESEKATRLVLDL